MITIDYCWEIRLFWTLVPWKGLRPHKNLKGSERERERERERQRQKYETEVETYSVSYFPENWIDTETSFLSALEGRQKTDDRCGGRK